MSEIGAAEYKASAEENLYAANASRMAGAYSVSHYLSGLSVECILRAYRWRIRQEWDGRHALVRLYRAAEFDRLIHRSDESAFADHFETVVASWNNEHRFISPAKLISFLNASGFTVNVKGDKLKEHSRKIYDAAEAIVELGLRKWK